MNLQLAATPPHELDKCDICHIYHCTVCGCNRPR